MSQSEKAAYYGALKEAGVKFGKPYRDYTTKELKNIAESEGVAAPVEEPIVLEPVATTQAPAEPMAAETAYSATNEQPIRTDEHGRIWFVRRCASRPLPDPAPAASSSTWTRVPRRCEPPRAGTSSSRSRSQAPALG